MAAAETANTKTAINADRNQIDLVMGTIGMTLERFTFAVPDKELRINSPSGDSHSPTLYYCGESVLENLDPAPQIWRSRTLPRSGPMRESGNLAMPVANRFNKAVVVRRT
jgi:hypothetical protein